VGQRQAVQQRRQAILTGDTARVSEREALVSLATIYISTRLVHRAGSVWLEQLGQLIRRNGPAEEVPLGFVTIVCP